MTSSDLPLSKIGMDAELMAETDCAGDAETGGVKSGAGIDMARLS